MSFDVNDTEPRVQYTASSGQTVFAVPFEFLQDSDIVVYLTAAGADPDDTTDLLTIVTDYTLTGAGVEGGGNLTLVVPATLNDVITIKRDIAIERVDTDYQNSGDFLAEALNTDMDRAIMMIQQLESIINSRMMRIQDTDVSADLTLPNITNRKGKYLFFDAVTGVPTAANELTVGVLTVTAYIQTLLDDATAIAARQTLGIKTGVETFTSVAATTNAVNHNVDNPFGHDNFTVICSVTGINQVGGRSVAGANGYMTEFGDVDNISTFIPIPSVQNFGISVYNSTGSPLTINVAWIAIETA